MPTDVGLLAFWLLLATVQPASVGGDPCQLYADFNISE